MSQSTDRRTVNLLGAASLALTDRMRQKTEVAAGQSAAAPAALIALHEFLGGGTVDDLRRVVGLTPSGAVRLVDRLVEAGHVERRPGGDGRSLALVLTAKGRRVARRARAARGEALADVVGALDERARADLADALEQMLAFLTADRLAGRAEGRDPGGWMCRLCDFEACGRERGECPAANEAAADTDV